MTPKHPQSQLGMFGLLELVIFAFVICIAMSSFLLYHNARRHTDLQAQPAEAVRRMRDALQMYAKSNKAAIDAGTPILYVNNYLAPTPAELQTLGYLTTTVVNPWSATGSWLTQLQVVAGGSISGWVSSDTGVTRAGAPDETTACNIADQIGDSGLCSPPGNTTVLGNGTQQVANNAGQRAIVGALVYVP